MKYLVTGGAGFIGSNIVRRLVNDGKLVRVLDDISTGRMENIADLGDSIDFVRGDVRDRETVAKCLENVRFVFHLAALPSVVRSVEDPVRSNDVNINGTLNVLECARTAGVDRYVMASSSSVYGDTEVLPKREDMKPDPLSPYALQKLTGELYSRIYYQLYGLKTFCLRFFNVFGPRQNPASDYAAVIPLFIRLVTAGEPPIINGDGGQTRDFTYVEDVVEAHLRCCEAPEEAAGEAYNIGCGARTSVNELVALIIEAMGKDGLEPLHREARDGDVRDSQACLEKVTNALGWKPKVDIRQGLKHTMDFFSNGNS